MAPKSLVICASSTARVWALHWAVALCMSLGLQGKSKVRGQWAFQVTYGIYKLIIEGRGLCPKRLIDLISELLEYYLTSYMRHMTLPFCRKYLVKMHTLTGLAPKWH